MQFLEMPNIASPSHFQNRACDVRGACVRGEAKTLEDKMNTLVAVAIAPFGIGDELSKEVAEVVKVIRESGLPNKTSSMFTEIEGEWDEVMKVVKDATFVLAQKGIRTEVVMKMDIRPGYENMMSEKLVRMENQMTDTSKAAKAGKKEEK